MIDTETVTVIGKGIEIETEDGEGGQALVLHLTLPTEGGATVQSGGGVTDHAGRAHVAATGGPVQDIDGHAVGAAVVDAVALAAGNAIAVGSGKESAAESETERGSERRSGRKSERKRKPKKESDKWRRQI